MKSINMLLTLGLASLGIATPMKVEEEPIDDIVDEVIRRSFEDDKTPDDSALVKRMHPGWGQTGPNVGGAGYHNAYGYNPYDHGVPGYGNPYGHGGPGFGNPYDHGGPGFGNPYNHGGPMGMNPMTHPTQFTFGNGQHVDSPPPPPTYPVQIPVAQAYNPFMYFGGPNQPLIAWKSDKRIGFVKLLVSEPWVGYAGPKFPMAPHVSYIVYKKNHNFRNVPNKSRYKTVLSLNVVRYYEPVSQTPCVYIWDAMKNTTEPLHNKCTQRYLSTNAGATATVEIVKKVMFENVKRGSIVIAASAIILPLAPFVALGIALIAAS